MISQLHPLMCMSICGQNSDITNLWKIFKFLDLFIVRIKRPDQIL